MENNSCKTANSPISLEEKHTFYLSRGFGWQVIIARGLREWLKVFSEIVRPRHFIPVQLPRLILVPLIDHKMTHQEWIEEMNNELKLNLPLAGWTVRESRPIRIWNHEDTRDRICEFPQTSNYMLNITMVCNLFNCMYEPVLETGGFPLHAALISKQDKGILLAGNGNIGKSTCCERVSGTWRGICDDEVLIVRDNSNGYFVHPMPTWSDYFSNRPRKTGYVEESIPLSAIFFLKQSATDKVEKLTFDRTASYLYELSRAIYARNYRKLNTKEQLPFSVKKKLFDNACDMSAVVPGYMLQFTKDGRFWEAIEGVL